MSLSSYPFGQTGLSFPRIGLGLAAIGRPGYINLGHAEDLQENYDIAVMEANAHRMLDLAYNLGIRYFDAAQSYGKAEDFAHSWTQTRALDPTQTHIGSKWGYTYTADWQVEAEKHEVKDHSLKVLNLQWDSSQKLLPYLKLYQIHSATFESGVLTNTEVLNRLAQLKQEGLLIGLSLSGTKQSEVLEAALAIEIDGVRLFDSVQATYNILEQAAGPMLEKAAEAGLGILIKEAVANGRLTSRNQSPVFLKQMSILNEIAKKHKVGVDAIAMAFILAHHWAHLVLSGAAQEAHLRSNLDALNIQLSPKEFHQLQALKEDSQSYWTKRSQLSWN